MVSDRRGDGHSRRRRRRRIEIIQKEKYTEVPVVEYKYVTIEVPKIEIVEKIVEVPQVEIVEVPKEYIIEVPQVEVVEKIVEVPVDQHVEVPVEVTKEVTVYNDVNRFTPTCYEEIQPYEFRLPTVETEYTVKKVSVLVPRFIQVPVPSYLLTDEQKQEMSSLRDHVERLANHPSPSLSDLEQVTEWLVMRQNELKQLQENPQPTKDYFEKAAARLPTGTFSSLSQTAQPRMMSNSGAIPFSMPETKKVSGAATSTGGSRNTLTSKSSRRDKRVDR
eukprot:GHVH01005404.1.p1 GENE.GHVH01005404.1~~GHVH01005404.1.p1  ORF type:complete len:276 (+),score=29.00 GHVH01005404.1:154-981(+)